MNADMFVGVRVWGAYFCTNDPGTGNFAGFILINGARGCFMPVVGMLEGRALEER